MDNNQHKFEKIAIIILHGYLRPHTAWELLLFTFTTLLLVILVCFQSGGISRLYVCYRLVMATFFCSTIVHSMMFFPSYAKWFVYLTHWSYTVIAANTFLQAVYVTRHYVDANNKANDKGKYVMMRFSFYYFGNVFPISDK